MPNPNFLPQESKPAEEKGKAEGKATPKETGYSKTTATTNKEAATTEFK